MTEARKHSPVTLIVGEDYSQAISFADELNGRTIVSAHHTAWLEWLDEMNLDICPTNPVIDGSNVKLRLTAQEEDRGKKWRVYLIAVLNSGEAVGHLLHIDVV